MKRSTFVFWILTLILFFTGCTVMPTTQMSTPEPAEKKSIETPLSRQSEYHKLTLNDIIAAYSNENYDKTLTQLELKERISGKSSSYIDHFPRISNAYIDPKGIVHVTLGAIWKSLLIDRYAVTSYIGEVKDPTPDDVPPPLQNIGLRGGTILLLPKLADGTTIHEALKSVARNEDIYLEIFERPRDHTYPYIKSLPYPIADITKLKKGDPLIFYGSSIISGKEGFVFTPTEKRGEVSFVDIEQSLIHIKGSVLSGDYGAPVFLVQCGEKKLAGLIIGSISRSSNNSVTEDEDQVENEDENKIVNERESYIIGINEVFRFVEENTKIKVKFPENSKECPDYSEDANERVISAISDGKYDFSYDICDLRQCEVEKITPHVRLFQNVWVYKDNMAYEIIISEGYALLVDEYAIVIASSQPPLIINDEEDTKKRQYENKYRIVLDGPVYGENAEETKYEYVEFEGIDDSRRVAIFKRANVKKPDLNSRFPFGVGTSRELAYKNALYVFGQGEELSVIKEIRRPQYRQGIDTASVSGFPPSKSEHFYFQGTVDEKDFGAPIFAIRDGNFELVGFVYNRGVLYSNKAEYVGTALTVDFVMNAGKEIMCKKIGELKCKMIKIPERPQGTILLSPEAVRDREDILGVFNDEDYSYSSFVENIDPVNYTEHLKRERKLTILFYDKTGSRIYGLPAVFGSATIISEDYAITSASLFDVHPSQELSQFLLFETRKDTVTSNILYSNKGETIEARLALSDNFLMDEDVAELLREIPFLIEIRENLFNDEYWKNLDGSRFTQITIQLENVFSYHNKKEFFKEVRDKELDPDSLRQILIKDAYQKFSSEIINKMEIVDVALVDYENEYALLKRSSSHSVPTSEVPITESKNLKSNLEIVIVQSQDILTHESPERVKLISPGSIISKEDSGKFVISGFIPRDSRGVPIFAMRNVNPELIGIVSNSYPQFPDQIQSDGYGVTIDFVFQRIKEKIGLDLAIGK